MDRTETARQTLAAYPVRELRDLARDQNVVGRSKMRKAELVEALIPSTLAEMALVEANRRASLAIATDSPYPAPATDFFAHTSAVAMHEAQLAWEEAEGEVAQGAAWEDYVDACYEAGLCTEPGCEAEAADTDDEHRCPTHLRGAALGDDVSRETADEAPAQLRCTQCGSDHGRRGFSIGRTRHGDYEYDATWGESPKSIKIPRGWELAHPNATEPNVIECDCWPNGVRSYRR